jgi:hypothetical protein
MRTTCHECAGSYDSFGGLTIVYSSPVKTCRETADFWCLLFSKVHYSFQTKVNTKKERPYIFKTKCHGGLIVVSFTKMKDVEDSHHYLVFYVVEYPVSMTVADHSSAGANDLGRSRRWGRRAMALEALFHAWCVSLWFLFRWGGIAEVEVLVANLFGGLPVNFRTFKVNK